MTYSVCISIGKCVTSWNTVYIGLCGVIRSRHFVKTKIHRAPPCDTCSNTRTRQQSVTSFDQFWLNDITVTMQPRRFKTGWKKRYHWILSKYYITQIHWKQIFRAICHFVKTAKIWYDVPYSSTSDMSPPPPHSVSNQSTHPSICI